MEAAQGVGGGYFVKISLKNVKLKCYIYYLFWGCGSCANRPEVHGKVHPHRHLLCCAVLQGREMPCVRIGCPGFLTYAVGPSRYVYIEDKEGRKKVGNGLSRTV